MPARPAVSADVLMKKKTPWWIWMLAPVPVVAVVLVLIPPGKSPLEVGGSSSAQARAALSMERRPMPVPIPLAEGLPAAPSAPIATKVAPSLPRTQAEVVQAREALKERERRLLAPPSRAQSRGARGHPRSDSGDSFLQRRPPRLRGPGRPSFLARPREARRPHDGRALRSQPARPLGVEAMA